jgi:hypothetical protein
MAPVHFTVEMQKANFQYWNKYYGHASRFLYLVIICIHQAVRVLGYLPMLLGSKARRLEATFKVKRSVACIRWVIGFEDTRGVPVR